MTLGSIILTIIVGLVLGVLGRLFAPGKQSIPIWLTIVVGIIASFLGTAIARGLGYADTKGIDWLELITQIVLAAILVSLAAGLYGRSKVRR